MSTLIKTKKFNHMIFSNIIIIFSVISSFFLIRLNHLNYKLLSVHFNYVLISSIISFILGLNAYREFRENKSIRIYYIVIGFLGGAIIYFFHGLITPGYLPIQFPNINNHIDGFIFFGDLSRFWFALMIFIPEFKDNNKIFKENSKNLIIILIVLTTFLIILTFNPEFFPSFKNSNGMDTYFSILFKVITLVLLGIEAIKYYMSYKIKRSFSILAIFLGNLLIMGSIIIFMISIPWSPIWWFAHNLFLMSFAIMGLGFIYNKHNNELFTFFDVMIELNKHVNELNGKNEELKIMINSDNLTGLLNRKAFIDNLEILIEKNESNTKGFALMYLDLDGFKSINDTYGHNIGDEVLKIVSKRLRNSIKETDLIARIGGDEYTILMPTNDKDYISSVAQRIIKTISREISIDNCYCDITASIGISLFPMDGLTVGELIEKSDQAMYKVKDNQKNDFIFYN